MNIDYSSHSHRHPQSRLRLLLLFQKDPFPVRSGSTVVVDQTRPRLRLWRHVQRIPTSRLAASYYCMRCRTRKRSLQCNEDKSVYWRGRNKRLISFSFSSVPPRASLTFWCLLSWLIGRFLLCPISYGHRRNFSSMPEWFREGVLSSTKSRNVEDDILICRRDLIHIALILIRWLEMM